MAKQAFQMHLYAKEVHDYLNCTSEVRYGICAWKDADYMGCYVGPVTVEAEVPESFNMHAAKVAAKEAEIAAVRAEFNRRIVQLQQELSKLQAIEFVAEAA